MKYILKESELEGILTGIIQEEISAGINEGVLGTIGKIAKGGAMLVGAPVIAANRAYQNLNGFLNGGPGASKIGGRSAASSSKTKKSGGKSKNGRGNDTVSLNGYGQPQTQGGLGRRLERRREIIVHDFLGSGEDVNFGRHYYERNQDAPGSVWSRMLRRAEEDIAESPDPGRADRYRRQHRRRIARWLRERDRVYQEYIRTNRGRN